MDPRFASVLLPNGVDATSQLMKTSEENETLKAQIQQLQQREAERIQQEQQARAAEALARNSAHASQIDELVRNLEHMLPLVDPHDVPTIRNNLDAMRVSAGKRARGELLTPDEESILITASNAVVASKLRAQNSAAPVDIQGFNGFNQSLAAHNAQRLWETSGYLNPATVAKYQQILNQGGTHNQAVAIAQASAVQQQQQQQMQQPMAGAGPAGISVGASASSGAFLGGVGIGASAACARLQYTVPAHIHADGVTVHAIGASHVAPQVAYQSRRQYEEGKAPKLFREVPGAYDTIPQLPVGASIIVQQRYGKVESIPSRNSRFAVGASDSEHFRKRGLGPNDKMGRAVILSSVKEFCATEARDPNFVPTDDINHGAMVYLWGAIQQDPEWVDTLRTMSKQPAGVIHASKNVRDRIEAHWRARGWNGGIGASRNSVGAADRDSSALRDDDRNVIIPYFDNAEGPYPDPQWDRSIFRKDGLDDWEVHRRTLTSFAW